MKMIEHDTSETRASQMRYRLFQLFLVYRDVYLHNHFDSYDNWTLAWAYTENSILRPRGTAYWGGFRNTYFTIDFVNEFGLQNIGNARFQQTGDSGEPTFAAPKEETLGKVQAGFLEKSNTNITDEIVLMLRTQRAFNGCSKILQSEIDVTKKLSAR